MEPVSTFFGLSASRAATTKLFNAVWDEANSRLNPDEMVSALQKAEVAADVAQPELGGLFRRIDRDGANGERKFLKFFQSGEVLKELQKPEKPNVNILVEAFKRSVSEHPEAENYLSDLMPLWMETFVESYFEETKGICIQVAKVQYLKQLAKRVDDVKFVGIAVPGDEVEKQEVLAQIFVMPDVREESRTSLQKLSRPEWGDLKDWHFNGYFPDWESQEEQQRLITQQKEWAMRDRSAPRIPAPKILNLSQKKAVVLGAPGSGKTMLASYFALMLCETPQSDRTQIGLEDDDYLPIVVRIRDWILSPGMGLLDYLRSNAKDSLACKELPAGFFEHWLERGQALILLDGLDEVVDEAQRRKVAEQIETFLHRYQNNPAVITSRPAGYRKDFFNLDEFPHYTLESFDDKQVATFIDHWYDSRLKDDKAQAERRKADLQKAFARNERIKLLAKNPLLLTIITLIHRYQAELPRQRYKLYEKAVETLLTSWDSGKEIKLYSQVLRFLKPDDLLYILKKLAYWIHTQGSTGETEGGTLIDKDELIGQLRTEIQKITACKTHEAKAEAERFVDFIQKRTGLLNEQGRDRYAFVHKTFQEYLTAEEIYEIDESGEDTEIIGKHFREHLHDQHWREVLLLLVSKLKGKKAQKAIQTVLEAQSEYEQWLHRDLLFAGWCLTEDPSRLTTVAKDFVGGILDRLVGLEVGNSNRIGGKIKDEIEKILHCFGETSLERYVWEKLQAQGDLIDRFRLIEFHAALGQKEKSIDTLLQLLNVQELDTRFRAAAALGNLGNTSPAVINALLSLLKDPDQDSFLRSIAARALVQLENADTQVFNSLLSLLKDPNSYVRFSAAAALGDLGNASPEVISHLLSLLGDPELEVRSYAVSALARLGNANPDVIDALLSLLQDRDQDSFLRSITARSLVRLGNTSEEVENVLLSLLHDSSSQVRSIGAVVLSWIGNTSQEVECVLLSLLYDASSHVRSRVAAELGMLSKTSDTIRPKVLQWLEQNRDEDVMGCAIDCLWSIVLE